MSIYTYTNEEFFTIHSKLSEAFDSEAPEVHFGTVVIETIPRNTTPVRLFGEHNPFYGKTHSEEHKANQKERRKNVSYDELYGERASEIRNKQSEAKVGENNSFYGRTHSQEALDKIREVANNRPKLTCPHCSKISDSSNAKRWHFDRCNFKQLVNE